MALNGAHESGLEDKHNEVSSNKQHTTLSVNNSIWSTDKTSAMRAPLLRMTPFGSPVVPLVYIIVHTFVFSLGGKSCWIWTFKDRWKKQFECPSLKDIHRITDWL